MTHQEAFDRVARHLATMEGKSWEFTGVAVGCAYRSSSSGKKCAIGCLIPDDEHRPGMEGQLADEVQAKFDIPSLRGLSDNFLLALQRVHDAYSRKEDRLDELLTLARHWELDPTTCRDAFRAQGVGL